MTYTVLRYLQKQPASLTSKSGIFSFLLFEKNGRSGDGKRNTDLIGYSTIQVYCVILLASGVALHEKTHQLVYR